MIQDIIQLPVTIKKPCHDFKQKNDKRQVRGSSRVLRGQILIPNIRKSSQYLQKIQPL